MAFQYHERLSALDASFLALEDVSCHMHIGAVSIFDGGPLTLPGGGIDIDRIRGLIEAGLYRIPRYRQRLAHVPLVGHPVWVDDPCFNLAYHVRHTHLPCPGDTRQLKRLVGRLMSQQLDRGKPLWELWVVEGLEGGRFAFVNKVHHCMIDGVGSVELTGTVMQRTPEHDPRLDEAPPRWLPRPAPTAGRLLSDELLHRARAPLAAVTAAGRAITSPGQAWNAATATVQGLAEALSGGLNPASPSPLNVEIGPHRRFDWTEMDLGRIREVKARYGGTVNDVVLAILSGALRRFLRRRSVDVDGLEFRAMLPVNVRTAADQRDLGNRVAMLVARLPLDERDPQQRLVRIVEETQRVKHSHQAAGVQTLEALSDQTFTTLFTEFGRLAARSRPFNLVVTNVPGPQFPVYVLGSRMQVCYPLVPLFRGQALGVALFSYDGRLFWGFNADWDAIPDLHELVTTVDGELEALVGIAAVAS
jgi:WS/DGAT/MGAT family acyltransferase